MNGSLLKRLKKTPLARAARGARGPTQLVRLSLFDRDSVFRANLDAALASEALFGVCRKRLAVPHFKNFNGADIDAFFTTNAFFFIDGGIKSHSLISFQVELSIKAFSLKSQLVETG
jgi:hypothetical protein